MMINEDILIRFLEQSCSPQELKEVDEWIQASPETGTNSLSSNECGA